MLDIHHIVNSAHDRRASDIHIVCGLPIRIRVDGQLENLDEYVLTHDDCDAIGYALAGDDFETVKD